MHRQECLCHEALRSSSELTQEPNKHRGRRGKSEGTEDFSELLEHKSPPFRHKTPKGWGTLKVICAEAFDRKSGAKRSP